MLTTDHGPPTAIAGVKLVPLLGPELAEERVKNRTTWLLRAFLVLE